MSNQVMELEALPAVAREQQLVAPSMGAVTPVDLLRRALDSGADLDRLERLMDLQQRYEEAEARKAYVADMALFKMNPPQIIKDKVVAFSGTSYTHATLGNVTGAIVEGLAQHGFSHRWDTEQQGANVSVTCILTHRMGHSERTTLTAAKDDSGKKNSIQQMASAITYLQRYTLLAATGLATKDMGDDDGAAADMREGVEKRRNDPEANKQSIDKGALQKALDQILAGRYSRVDLEGYYKLTPEQVEHVDSVLGKRAA